MPTKHDSLAPSLSQSAEPLSPAHAPRPPVTNVLLLGQHLAQAFGPAQALINQIPSDLSELVENLRRWYHRQHPADRARLLWQRFLDAEQTYRHLDSAIRIVQQAIEVERVALAQADAERTALATQPLSVTVEQEATRPRVEAVHRYETMRHECGQRQAALTDLERLLTEPERRLAALIEATGRMLEAAVTIEREVFVSRVRDSGELEQLRSRLERLRTMAHMHEAEIAEWGQRAGRSLHVPSIDFPWLPVPIWNALLDVPVRAPRLVWSDAPTGPGA